jgi:hypothetical protein
LPIKIPPSRCPTHAAIVMKSTPHGDR